VGIYCGDGAEKLRIGSYGDFEFAASGPVLTNSFWADGTTNITNIAEFKSLNRSDLRSFISPRQP
jgi:hypothetical protein